VNVFRKKQTPNRRSYSVTMVVDTSGSTDAYLFDREAGEYIDVNGEHVRLWGAMMSGAFLVSRMVDDLGIPTSILSHTLANHTSSASEYYGEISVIKSWSERWQSDEVMTRMAANPPSSGNLDGSVLRLSRKWSEMGPRATDRLVLYWTDGAIPAFDNERESLILEAESKRTVMSKANRTTRTHVICVGVGTSSPRKFGLDTIYMDNECLSAGPAAMLTHLAKELARRIDNPFASEFVHPVVEA
jgi:nitric oxide reductase activation protein